MNRLSFSILKIVLLLSFRSNTFSIKFLFGLDNKALTNKTKFCLLSSSFLPPNPPLSSQEIRIAHIKLNKSGLGWQSESVKRFQQQLTLPNHLCRHGHDGVLEEAVFSQSLQRTGPEGRCPCQSLLTRRIAVSLIPAHPGDQQSSGHPEGTSQSSEDLNGKRKTKLVNLKAFPLLYQLHM